MTFNGDGLGKKRNANHDKPIVDIFKHLKILDGIKL